MNEIWFCRFVPLSAKWNFFYFFYFLFYFQRFDGWTGSRGRIISFIIHQAAGVSPLWRQRCFCLAFAAKPQCIDWFDTFPDRKQTINAEKKEDIFPRRNRSTFPLIWRYQWRWMKPTYSSKSCIQFGLKADFSVQVIAMYVILPVDCTHLTA